MYNFVTPAKLSAFVRSSCRFFFFHLLCFFPLLHFTSFSISFSFHLLICMSFIPSSECCTLLSFLLGSFLNQKAMTHLWKMTIGRECRAKIGRLCLRTQFLCGRNNNMESWYNIGGETEECKNYMLCPGFFQVDYLVKSDGMCICFSFFCLKCLCVLLLPQL